MTTHNIRGGSPVVVLIVGLMAMALSCGGFAQEATAPQRAETTADSSSNDQFASDQGRLLGQGPAGAPGPSGDRGEVQESAPAATRAPSTASAAAPTAVPTSGEPEGASVSDSSQNQSDRQLIVESWVGLEVDNIDAAVRHVETIAAQRGGWVESAEIYGEAGYRSATVQLRVPADRSDNVLDTLRGLGRVTDEGVSSTDVTERLIDNEARLSAWHAQEARLVTLLENAPTVEDIIQIEQRIAQNLSTISEIG